MFALILFDCDGVLIESEILANQIEIEEIHQLGYEFEDSAYLEMAIGRPQKEVDRILTEEWKIKLPENFWEEVEKKQEWLFRQKLQPVKGVKEILAKLSIPKVVVSNSKVQRLEHTLSLAGLLPYFERIFSSEHVERGKPFPDLLLYAAKEMGVDPKQCLVIEDSLAGVQASQAANMKVWVFDGGAHITDAKRREILSWGADMIFHQMGDLTFLLQGGLVA